MKRILSYKRKNDKESNGHDVSLSILSVQSNNWPIIPFLNKRDIETKALSADENL